MTALYKDFNKEVKDLLTKNYQKTGTWAVECKAKGPNKSVFVNPIADNNGVSVDVEYNCSDCGIKTKTRVDNKFGLKPKVTYEKNGHKVDLSSDKNLNYEVAYEGKFGKLRVNDKLTRKTAEAAAAFAVAPHCFVGAGIVYGLESSKVNWSAGMRYAFSGKVVDIVTNDLQKFTTGLHAPVEVAGRKVNVAFQANCARAGGFDGKLGLETACIMCPNSTLKFNIDNKLKYGLSYISKFNGGWKSIISLDANLKVGVLFQYE